MKKLDSAPKKMDFDEIFRKCSVYQVIRLNQNKKFSNFFGCHFGHFFGQIVNFFAKSRLIKIAIAQSILKLERKQDHLWNPKNMQKNKKLKKKSNFLEKRKRAPIFVF